MREKSGRCDIGEKNVLFIFQEKTREFTKGKRQKWKKGEIRERSYGVMRECNDRGKEKRD